MSPRDEAAIPPLAEHGRLEHEAVALQEGQEAAAEAGAVEVEEVPVPPVGLEVGLVPEPELAGLVLAVPVPAAGDAIDDSHVEVETECGDGGGREEGVSIGVGLGWVWEENGERVRGVVGEVDETLSSHAFPGCVLGETF